MNINTLKIGVIMALFTVMIGAFGAHGLKDILSQYGTKEVFETAVQYQGMHAIALIFVGILGMSFDAKYLSLAKWFFLIGTVLFSGSLYVLSVTGIKFLGAITPIGGLLFILGWGSVLLGLNKKKDSSN